MSKRQLKVLLNIGYDHHKKHNIPLAAEGEVVAVTEEQAHVMVNMLKAAKDYNAEEEDKHRLAVEEFDRANLEAEVRSLQNEAQRKEMMERQLAEAKARVSGRVPRGVRSHAVEEESPVDSDTADEARDKISRMTSRDKLQSIADSDKRSTVQDAARKRLNEIG